MNTYLSKEDIKLLKNFKWSECDVYKGKKIFANYKKVRKHFMFDVDRYVSYGKSLGGMSFLVHDINNYEHSPDSAHIIDGCAIDGHWRRLCPYEAIFLALHHPFTGIFVYPYRNQWFIHLDQKTRNRPQRLVTLGFEDTNGAMITTNKDFELVMNTIRNLKIRKEDPLNNST